MGQKNEHLWGESSAIEPGFFNWYPAKASDRIHIGMPYVYISDKRIEELQRDIRELKEKVDNIERKLSTRENESLFDDVSIRGCTE